MQHVFTYGSLMYSAVWDSLVKGQYLKVPAKLFAFERKQVKGEEYPAIKPAMASSCVEGVVYLNVSDTDLAILDEFEGDLYDRQKVHIHAIDEKTNNPDKNSLDTASHFTQTLKAQVYVIRPENETLLAEAQWNPHQFEKEGLNRFLSDYRGFR